MQQHDYGLIDLTDDPNTTLMQKHFYFLYNKNDLQFPTHLFMCIAPKGQNNLSEDKYGIKIFKRKCLPRESVERTYDLRYFKMHSAKGKPL